MAMATGAGPIRDPTRVCPGDAPSGGRGRRGRSGLVMEPIVLDEYESAVAPLTAHEVADLRALAGRKLTVNASDTPGEWVITATAHVGTVVLGRVKVLIRPKVSNANLFHLLEAGGE